MITLEDLVRQLRAETERSTRTLRHIANMIEALNAGQVNVNEVGSWPVCITVTHPLDIGTIGQPAGSEEQGATEGG